MRHRPTQLDVNNAAKMSKAIWNIQFLSNLFQLDNTELDSTWPKADWPLRHQNTDEDFFLAMDYAGIASLSYVWKVIVWEQMV